MSSSRAIRSAAWPKILAPPFEELMAANGLTDANAIQIGQTLLIPSLISDTLTLGTSTPITTTGTLTATLAPTNTAAATSRRPSARPRRLSARPRRLSARPRRLRDSGSDADVVFAITTITTIVKRLSEKRFAAGVWGRRLQKEFLLWGWSSGKPPLHPTKRHLVGLRRPKPPFSDNI